MIITIARQCGSGGHEIGKELASRLGLELYDRKKLEEEAKKLGFDECILPQVSLDSMKDSGSVPKGIRLTGVRSVKDAMDAILK